MCAMQYENVSLDHHVERREKEMNRPAAILVATILSMMNISVEAGDSDDALFRDDREWIFALIEKHNALLSQTTAESDAYARWAESTDLSVYYPDGKMPRDWFSRLSTAYGRYIDVVQRDIEKTRARFLGRKPECIEALDKFERGDFARNNEDYATLLREQTLDTGFNGSSPAFKFPYFDCAVRHDKVREAKEDIRRMRSLRP